MSRIGVMMAENRAAGQISSHFGKAEWMLITEPEKQTVAFVKNEALNGKSAVELAIGQGCTDVIFTEIGNGAFGHLRAAGIRGWLAPEHLTGEQALNMFAASALQSVESSTRQGGGMGCCCGHHGGSEASSCCKR